MLVHTKENTLELQMPADNRSEFDFVTQVLLHVNNADQGSAIGMGRHFSFALAQNNKVGQESNK